VSIVVVTGSSGLVGSEAVRRFHSEGLDIVGVDNDLRAQLFGSKASTKHQIDLQVKQYKRFTPKFVDIRNYDALKVIFAKYGREISGIIHCAAQPSHDWAATNPTLDFQVNALGTLNLLELMREFCPESSFIFMSTNKVYGDSPNALPLQELETRYEIERSSCFYEFGIDERMSIDNSLHSLFGVSKASADLMVQEYGKYFGLKTVTFRGGCLTGPQHQGAELHGFLSYLVKCVVNKVPYTIFGYKGKQVRDNIHSRDLVSAFWEFYKNPTGGEIYNIGGSRFSNISMLEAITQIEALAKKRLFYSLTGENRRGDHMWYISDVRKFELHYPAWKIRIGMDEMLNEMVEGAKLEARG